jgi:nucleoside-diphosphate-sugar epimerase
VGGADAVVVATNHDVFADPKTIQLIVERAGGQSLVVDPWNVFGAARVFATADEVSALAGTSSLRGRHVDRGLSKVLVTGGAGTIGGAVRAAAGRRGGWTIRVSDQRPAPDWMERTCEIHTADLRDLNAARDAIADCTHVVHLAAIVGGIANFHKLPFTLLEVNHGLYNSIFHAAIDAGVERFVYVSSSMAFERAEEYPTTEESLDRTLTPRSSYGFSKLAGEYYCRAANDEFGFPFSIVRPFNAYGPGELPGDEPGIAHLVPDLIERCLIPEHPLKIFGSGEQTRTLTHIDDIARGIITA